MWKQTHGRQSTSVLGGPLQHQHARTRYTYFAPFWPLSGIEGEVDPEQSLRPTRQVIIEIRAIVRPWRVRAGGSLRSRPNLQSDEKRNEKHASTLTEQLGKQA